MRRPLFLAGAALAAVFAAAPAHAAMRGFLVTSFDTIRVEAPVRVILTTGSGVSGSGEGERDALDRIKLSVSGGVLTVGMADPARNGFSDSRPVPPPTLYLQTGQLRQARLTGGGALTIDGLSGLEVELSLNGNGEMIVGQIDIERLALFVSGGGRMTVDGSARDVRASVIGPGALEAGGLNARGATIANDGSGSIRISVHGPAKVVSTGSGGTVVEGKPICTIDRRGVGEVICGGL